MPSYDSDHFEPPAPVARVTLRGSDRSDAVTDVPMLLDTGADVSMVSRAAAEELALGGSEERFKLVGFDGSSSQALSVCMDWQGRVIVALDMQVCTCLSFSMCKPDLLHM